MNGKIQDSPRRRESCLQIWDTCKTSHRNKCNINETSKLFTKVVKIFEFASAKILEVPLDTPTKVTYCITFNCGDKLFFSFFVSVRRK